MKVKLFLIAFVMFTLNSICQSFELTFTADFNNSYVQLDSVKVHNLTQQTESIHIWPDTVYYIEVFSGDEFLLIGYSDDFNVGLQEYEIDSDRFTLFQNFPNPMVNSTIITLYIPGKGDVCLDIYDMLGRKLNSYNRTLDKGTHRFKLSSISEKMFFVSAQWENTVQSIKILSLSPQSGANSLLEFVSSSGNVPVFKTKPLNQGISIESGIWDIPSQSKTYTFQFAKNIPCIEHPTVSYEGKVYNTVQILSQCWLSENLNVGSMINGDLEQTNNGVVEKYCLNNVEDSCSIYGGLYQWNEMMNYNQAGDTNTICPPGWHVPTDIEWQILEGVADSQYGIVDSIWTSNWLYRGFDQALNLKSTTGWYSYGNGLDI
ncbi:MAG: hypothetical protein IH597_11085 [Bacteroidales bacterium]|nr:hypothetical protein [Bacteroidales bacterium]